MLPWMAGSGPRLSGLDFPFMGQPVWALDFFAFEADGGYDMTSPETGEDALIRAKGLTQLR